MRCIFWVRCVVCLVDSMTCLAFDASVDSSQEILRIDKSNNFMIFHIFKKPL